MSWRHIGTRLIGEKKREWCANEEMHLVRFWADNATMIHRYVTIMQTNCSHRPICALTGSIGHVKSLITRISWRIFQTYHAAFWRMCKRDKISCSNEQDQSNITTMLLSMNISCVYRIFNRSVETIKYFMLLINWSRSY